MSAFMCSDEHLIALAEYAVQKNLWLAGKCEHDRQASFQHALNTLYRANQASVNTRYPSDPDRTESPTVELSRGIPRKFNPIAILKSVHCYEYQACETHAWEYSDAFKLCRRIEKAAIQSLPGYAEAAWGAPE